MYNVDDTICAIATSLTPSGIGIIRISGNEAINIVSKVFVNSKKEKINISESHKVKYGYIYDKKNDIFIDEVLVIPFFIFYAAVIALREPDSRTDKNGPLPNYEIAISARLR